MKQIFAGHYEYKAGFHNFESWCHLSVWRDDAGRAVVIATEMNDNPGTSVTNAVEQLAEQVCREFKLDRATLSWFETYEIYELDRLDEVVFGYPELLRKPSWKPSSTAEMLARIAPARK